jgi:hypothetical protein
MAQLQKYRAVNITGLIENMTPRWRKGAEAYKTTWQRELKFLMALRCVEILKARLYRIWLWSNFVSRYAIKFTTMYTDVHNRPRVIALYVYYCEEEKSGGRTWYAMSDLRLSGRHGLLGCNAVKIKLSLYLINLASRRDDVWGSGNSSTILDFGTR